MLISSHRVLCGWSFFNVEGGCAQDFRYRRCSARGCFYVFTPMVTDAPPDVTIYLIYVAAADRAHYGCCNPHARRRTTERLVTPVWIKACPYKRSSNLVSRQSSLNVCARLRCVIVCAGTPSPRTWLLRSAWDSSKPSTSSAFFFISKCVWDLFRHLGSKLKFTSKPKPE